MDQDTKTLLDTMRELNRRVRLLESVGGLVKSFEVAPDSFVQLLEHRRVRKDEFCWLFHQVWVRNLTAFEQDAIAGAYHGDVIGDFKIIGIYTPSPVFPEFEKMWRGEK